MAHPIMKKDKNISKSSIIERFKVLGNRALWSYDYSSDTFDLPDDNVIHIALLQGGDFYDEIKLVYPLKDIKRVYDSEIASNYYEEISARRIAQEFFQMSVKEANDHVDKQQKIGF